MIWKRDLGRMHTAPSVLVHDIAVVALPFVSTQQRSNESISFSVNGAGIKSIRSERTREMRAE